MNLHDFYALYKKWFDTKDKNEEVVRENHKIESTSKEDINEQL